MPLCASEPSVKSCQQLPRGQMGHRVAPVGGDFDKGGEDEAALAKFGVGDCQAG
jgi:hypothetical protein